MWGTNKGLTVEGEYTLFDQRPNATMLTLEPGLYLRVVQLPNGPKPLPLESGFNTKTAYRALGLFNPSETSDAYFIFSNDRDEIWFICNRHLRAVGFMGDESRAVRMSLQAISSVQVPVARDEQGVASA